MTFTPEEAAKIPYGIAESILQEEMAKLSEQIDEKKPELDLLYVQYGLLRIILDKTDEIKRQYAKGELPKNE